MNKLKVGADPEYFLKVGRSWRSAHGLIEGTKEAPVKVKGGAIQIDGTAVEFNINPAEDPQEFSDNIQLVLQQLRDIIPEEYSFEFAPVANYNKDYFEKVIPEEAKILGCEPDYNAYTGNKNLTPNVNKTFRTAAGHIHFGWGENIPENDVNHFKDCRLMAAYADCFIGIPLGIIEPPNKRAELYGKAGAFRPKSYGFEYRTPSNNWLKSEKLQKLVFKQANRLYRLAQNEVNPLGRYHNNGNVQRMYDMYKGKDKSQKMWDYMKVNENLYEPELFEMAFRVNKGRQDDVWA